MDPRSPFPSATADNAWIARCSPPLRTAANGPLCGLKFAVKDNIDVAGMPTTAACPEFEFQPQAHAAVVDRLLGAGATLIGKTNLDQFACGLNGTRSPFGPVPNAVKPEFISGGSSSGSAFVVATGQVDFSLGTDTAGSGRVPAGLNGIVGLKPTKGLISTRGVLPAARSVDCVSIFAKRIEIAWQVFTQCIGLDDQDPYSRDLTLNRRALPKSFRFGLPTHLEWFGDLLSPKAFETSVEHLKALGGTPVEIDYTPLLEAANLLYGSALLAERLEAVGPLMERHPEAIIEPVRTLLSPGAKFSGVEVFQAMARLNALAHKAKKLWHDIDILVVPTTPTAYRIDEMLRDPIELNRRMGYYTNFVNLLDYAALSLPAGYREDGLPFGITLIGQAASDWQLAELGLRFQNLISEDPCPETGASTPIWPALPMPPNGPPTTQVAVVGAHLSGMPLNWQLTERGARLIKKTTTSRAYQLFALSDAQPPKPGLLRVPAAGSAIEIEIWEIPLSEYGGFVSLIPSPLGIGRIETIDGDLIQGFLCEPTALQSARNISDFGGWRAYLASQSAP